MPLDPHTPATEAQEHAALIVALDAGDLAGSDLARAEELTGSCPGCGALAADLGAIRDAMAALPVPARRRDYRLTPEDAARLRPSSWRRFRDWLAAPGSTVRPLATGLATLGVVGLLVTAGLPGFGAGGAMLSTVGSSVDSAAPSGAQAEDYGATAAPALAPVPGAGAPAAASRAPSEPNRAGVTDDGASPAPTDDGTSTTPTDERDSGVAGAEGVEGSGGPGDEKAATTDAAAGEGLPAGVILSLGLLLGGLGLFGARILARRRPA